MSPEDRAAFAAEIAVALKTHDTCLTGEEQRWVRLAIIRQEQSIKLRQAIIEKSLTSLIWSALAGLGYMAFEFAKNHGFK
jgi:hypothetical protein